jgi:CheY-like chemotaxis protein
MKKAIIIGITSVVLLILANVFYYYNTYKDQINIQQEILERQSMISRNQLDLYLQKTQTNILLLLSPEELTSLFTHRSNTNNSEKRIEFLFNNYKEILEELRIIDIDGNVFSLKRDASGTFISSYYRSEPLDMSKESIIFNEKDNTIDYIQPLNDETDTYGFVEFKVILHNYFNMMFNNFNIRGYHFQWITNNKHSIYNTLNAELTFSDLKKYEKTIFGADKVTLQHNLLINGKETRVLTVFRKININSGKYLMAFSMPLDSITAYIVRNAFIVGAITIFVILFFIAWSVFNIYIKNIEGKRLKQSQETLRKVLYYLPVGIVLADQENRIRQVNKAALNILSFDDEDQMLGQDADENILFENCTIIEKTDYSNTSFKAVIKNKHDEEMVILCEKIPFFLQSQKFTINLFLETSSLNIQKDIEGNGELKSNFIANISHELRTPLNGIIGMTDLLMGAELHVQEKDMLSVIKRSADTLLTLINDILDFSKIEAGKFEVESIPFNLHDEIENTINDFLVKAHENNIQLTWHSDIPLPKDFIGDPIRLRQVLNNLIGNAIKFTPMNGKIHLSLTETSSINGSKAVQFSVKDTGIGITKEKLDIIFKPFSQADETTTRKYGGTGLGITIAKQLVQLMGGDIRVVSPSEFSYNPKYPGAEFIFTLPLRTNKQSKAVDHSSITKISDIKALIITDNPLQVVTITKNLSSLHIRNKVLTPSNETLDFIKSDNGYHLVIIDNRPDFDGLEFLNDLHSHDLTSNVLIIVQSYDFQKANTRIAKQLGADAYLRKPVKLATMKEFIHQHFPAIDPEELNNTTVRTHDLKILIAEDNKLNQRVILNLFKKLSIDIDIAVNGKEAVKLASQKNYDLIFMDIFMPGMDGLTATAKLKNLNINIPVIGMSASADTEEKKNAKKAGMDDYITKPVKLEVLLRMITKWAPGI